MLRSKPPPRRSHEGAISRNDGTQSQSHQGLVPEQKVQRQEENHAAENANATGKGDNPYILLVPICSIADSTYLDTIAKPKGTISVGKS